MQKRKILVIDDCEPLLEEIRDFLTMKNFKVITAIDGAHGIQEALSQLPDLVICDISMPVMNGIEVYKTFEKIPNLSIIPFIFLTAKTQPEDFRMGMQLGADDYIPKPFEFSELMLSISKRIEKFDKISKISNTKFNALIQTPLVGVFMYQSGRIDIINERFTEITGYNKNELDKAKIAEIFKNDKPALNKLHICIDGGAESIRMKFYILSKDNQQKYIDLFGRFIEIEGKKSIIGNIVDITDLNILQSEHTNSTPENLKVQMIDDVTATKQHLSNFDKLKKSSIPIDVSLTKREKEILILICQGFTNSEIAKKLFLSIRTVENHRAGLLDKTQTKNTASLVAFSVSNRLID